MFKNGLVLGKFYPCTTGHLYLIDTAIDNCENVDVIVCSNSTQNIPGDVRFEAIKQIYKSNSNVKVYHFDDGHLPQSDKECKTLDEFYNLWVPEVYNIVNKLDVVFTSEDYGDDFAKYLGIKHIMVDKERIKYPISGTKVRNNPFECWDFIPKEMRHFFVKRIAIMGPESVGKSTMSIRLSDYFRTNYVQEYGRIVYERNGNKVSIDDFIPISIGRQELEDDLIKNSNKLIFCDTEDIITYTFSKMYHPNEYKLVEDWFLTQLNNKPKYDLYLLLNAECPSIQDGTRSFLNERVEHYHILKNELDKYKCNYVEVGGKDWDDRFHKSVDFVKSIFNI